MMCLSFRVSLFHLEKKRTEGLQYIVVILQKVYVRKYHLLFNYNFLLKYTRSWRQYRAFLREISAIKIQNVYRKYRTRSYINKLDQLFR